MLKKKMTGLAPESNSLIHTVNRPAKEASVIRSPPQEARLFGSLCPIMSRFKSICGSVSVVCFFG